MRSLLGLMPDDLPLYINFAWPRIKAAEEGGGLILSAEDSNQISAEQFRGCLLYQVKTRSIGASGEN